MPIHSLTETLPIHLDRSTFHTEESLRAVVVYFPPVSLCLLYFDVLVKHVADYRFNCVRLNRGQVMFLQIDLNLLLQYIALYYNVTVRWKEFIYSLI